MGWLAVQLHPTKDRIVFIENMAVAAFGSFAGGEFVNAMLHGGTRATGITLMAAVLAVAGSIVALLLLGLMRRVVGPLRPGKAKRQR